jgi:G:T-mismatch repair DNA endonuclease (very short patch repair protein)
MPRNNQEFWMNKLQGNKDRDKFVTRELRKMGWAVVRVWEHELKKPEKVAAKLKKYLSKKETVAFKVTVSLVVVEMRSIQPLPKSVSANRNFF